MVRAMTNDLAQRIITLNKFEQKRTLSRWVATLPIPDGGRVLDFGCGTGLFANVFSEKGFEYWGYDIADHLVRFASSLHKKSTFTSSRESLKRGAPFDLILANCCFHHIDDRTLDNELSALRGLLSDNGTFLMIDILLVENVSSLPHKLFMKLERGKHVRTAQGYRERVNCHFSVAREATVRSHVLSLKHRRNPLYNDLLVLSCAGKNKEGR